MLQGSPLTNGERAQAEPLVMRAPPELRGTAPPEQALDGVRYVRTVAVASNEDFLVAPVDILRCEQPVAGLWDPRSSAQSGCRSDKIARLSPDAAAGEAELPTTPAVADPVATAAEVPLSTLAAEKQEVAATAPVPETEVALPAGGPALAVPGEAAQAAAPAAPGKLRSDTDVKLLGRWFPKGDGCSQRGSKSDCLPLVIGERGAKAGPASCRFLRKQQDGHRFNVVARCVNAGERWTANIRLAVVGRRLTWTSERGSQDYVR